MPDTKITALTAIGANPIIPSTFPIPMVDLTDTSMAASGTTKKVTVNQILGAGGTATLASATITGDLTVDTSTLKVDSANNRVGIVQATPLYPLHLVGEFGLDETSAGNGSRLRLIGDASKYNFRLGKQITVSNAFEITPSTAAGGTTFSNPVYTVTYDGIHTFLDGAGGTRMTLNSTGLGVGVTPSYKLDVQGSGIRLNSGSATGFALLRLGGTASDSFFGFAGNANDIVTGSSAGDTVIGSNKAGANLRFISGNGVLNATLDASGNLLVGVTATPSGSIGGGGFIADTNSRKQLYLATTSAASQVLAVFLNPNGSVGTIETNGSSTAYNISSDYRLKDEVKPLTGALNRINALKPSTYKWKVDGSAGEGFIAHELAEVVPFAVSGQKDAVNEDGSIKAQGVDLSKVVPILVAAIQELTARVQTLEAR